MKHHYSPKFYLKRWAGPDGQLCEYKRLGGRVLCRRTFPDGTGYERDLYRVDGLPEPLAHYVESKFMHMVDTQAKHALDKIITDDQSPWDAEPRSAWTRFILSLLFRNPEAVNLIKPHMQEVWKAALDGLRANYENRRMPTDPPTFEEYMALTEPNAADKSAMSLLQEIIDDDRLGPTIFDMRWSRISLDASKLSLLTSDRPLDKPHGFASRNAYIALPVGPKTLFLAAHNDTMAKRLSACDPTEVVKASNAAVVCQARKFVWGIDDSHFRFVQNRMSSVPDNPIITDDQRREAIRAAALGPA
jgi:Protein of unknown function (DUF4238)